MYEKKNHRGWMKHLDFIILDMLCLQLAFVGAYMCRHGMVNPYRNENYLSLACVLWLLDFCVIIVFETFKNVLKRGYYREFVITVKHVFLVVGLSLFYLFVVKRGGEYSRIFFFIFGGLYFALGYVIRILWRKLILRRNLIGAEKSLIIVAPLEKMEGAIENLRVEQFPGFASVGAIVEDQDCKGTEINGVPVVANYRDALDYIRMKWVDEVFFITTLEKGYSTEVLDELNRMGVVVHIALTKAGMHTENKQQVQRLGNYTVLTTSMNYATPMQLCLKRCMDVAGGLVGCLITLLLVIIVGPAIYISSPGPIFFSQERVGQNGKRFKIYKFRTMHLDAEERKAELMAENRVDSGLMFKLDYDPRIIGNRKLPDGTIKEGVGSFLRKSSLDEFPQMFNILKGDMSLVGTRPPTLDEWKQYENHHRARLAFRPGLTGMWQVSGRSEITDFEEVVRLDTKYIDEWNLGLDIKILLLTVKSVLGKNGAM